MKKVYIAGPMRGRPDFNSAAFNEAEAAFTARGFRVWNPARHGKDFAGTGLDVADRPDFSPNATARYMRRDLPEVLGCDVVAVLEGWEKSIGARIEVWVARECGLEIVDARTGLSL